MKYFILSMWHWHLKGTALARKVISQIIIDTENIFPFFLSAINQLSPLHILALQWGFQVLQVISLQNEYVIIWKQLQVHVIGSKLIASLLTNSSPDI